MIEPTLNQYAPPTAAVADVSPHPQGTAEMNLFSAKGRIGRLRYLAYTTGASFLVSVVGGFAAALLQGSLLAVVIAIATYIALSWFTILCGIKRCHDLNISGWWSLTVVVPIISLLWIFFSGTKGANRFGPPPPPNTLGVKLLGLILPLVFGIGVLAAIALPAYSGYMAKARAAQSAGQR